MDYMMKLGTSSEMAKWDLALISLSHEKSNISRNPNEKVVVFQVSAWNPKVAHEQIEGNNGKRRVTVIRRQ